MGIDKRAVSLLYCMEDHSPPRYISDQLHTQGYLCKGRLERGETPLSLHEGWRLLNM